MKTTYFFARKKWAVRENIKDIVNYLKNLGDTDIEEHMRACSSRATYVSVESADHYLKCLSDYREEGLLARLISEQDFALLADESSDISNHAELATFIRYVDANSH